MVSNKFSIAGLGLASAIILGAASSGCGGDAPPPAPSATDFEAAKQKQQDIMARERASVGGSAKKGSAKH